jgi:mono/diheme cytochrome c family protein
MRFLAIVFVVAVGVGVFLWERNHRAPAAPPAPPRHHEPAIIRKESQTNGPGEPAQGFFIGKGDEKVFVNYSTRDPLLQSFMQSVMTSSADPNAQGREIFLRICAACHQKDGDGKDGVAPPLAGSEWALTRGGHRLILIALNGLSGPVHVRDRDWNMAMPPWRENLSDDQLAVVLTYIRTQVGTNHAEAITPEMVAAAREQAHPKPESAEELLRIGDK